MPASAEQNASSLEFLAQKLSYSENVFFGGDLNCVLDPYKDTCNISRSSPYPGKGSLLQIAQKLQIADVYRRLYPDGNDMSRIDLANSSGSRIDTLLCSENKSRFLEKVEYLDTAYSEHRMMLTHFRFVSNFRPLSQNLRQLCWKPFLEKEHKVQ